MGTQGFTSANNIAMTHQKILRFGVLLSPSPMAFHKPVRKGGTDKG